jgi:hypothetical protein
MKSEPVEVGRKFRAVIVELKSLDRIFISAAVGRVVTLVFQSDATLLGVPACPACAQPMRWESSDPSTAFAHIRHYIFVCSNCSVTTDQIIAVPASE